MREVMMARQPVDTISQAVTCTRGVQSHENSIAVQGKFDFYFICMGWVLWIRNYLFWFRFRLWKSFGSDSGSGTKFGYRPYSALFFSVNVLMLEAALLPRKIYKVSVRTFVIPFFSDPGSNPEPDPGRFRFRKGKKFWIRIPKTLTPHMAHRRALYSISYHYTHAEPLFCGYW